MRYDGGKNGSGVFQRIICMMPPHDTYIEAFAGSAAILRRKRPALNSIAYELDRRTIRDLAAALPADKFEPWNINAEWNYPDELPGCGGTSIGFNEPGTARTNLEIFNVDAFEAIRSKFVASAYFWGLNDPTKTVLYVDPPYPADVRKYKRPVYKFELMAAAEHESLCKLLLAVPCKVLLSGYENELYNDILRGWRKETIATTNRAGDRVIETVWLNYPEPFELHDYQHVGTDHRDRWRMTKRLRNWTGQLDAMKPAERGAMLTQLMAAVEAKNEAAGAADEAESAKRARRAAKFERKLDALEILTPNSAPPDLAEQLLFGCCDCGTATGKHRKRCGAI